MRCIVVAKLYNFETMHTDTLNFRCEFLSNAFHSRPLHFQCWC